MAYGDNRDYPKIDCFVNNVYYGTTTWSKSCKEARERLAFDLKISIKSVTAFYQD